MQYKTMPYQLPDGADISKPYGGAGPISSSMGDARLMTGPAKTAAAPPPPGPAGKAYFDEPAMFGRLARPDVDARNETIEGRIGGLLETDQRGNYTNQVVRQSVDRQNQAFNARGMLNSSMAVQAGQEAAISRAVDIAAPDAQTYFNNRRANMGIAADVDSSIRQQANTLEQKNHDSIIDQNKVNRQAEIDAAARAQQQQMDLERMNRQGQIDTERVGTQNQFQVRQDYQRAVQQVVQNYQRQIDTINASNMTPADKDVAIRQATAVRDGEVAFQNNLFAKMPDWQREWLAEAVPTQGLDLSQSGDVNALSTIANDPAQQPATREAARQRLVALGQNPAAVQGSGVSVAPEQQQPQGGGAFGGWYDGNAS